MPLWSGSSTGIMCLTLYSGKASSAAFVKRLSSIKTVRTSAKHKTHTHFVRKNIYTFIFLLFSSSCEKCLDSSKSVANLNQNPIASAHHQQSSSNSSSCWIPPHHWTQILVPPEEKILSSPRWIGSLFLFSLLLVGMKWIEANSSACLWNGSNSSEENWVMELASWWSLVGVCPWDEEFLER